MRFLGVAMLFLPICYGLVDVGAVVCIGVWLGWLAGCAGRGVRLHLRSFWWFARISGGGGGGGGGQGFGPLIYLNGRAEGEIHLNGLFLAGADVCGFLYSSIGCLQVYRMYITSF